MKNIQSLDQLIITAEKNIKDETLLKNKAKLEPHPLFDELDLIIQKSSLKNIESNQKKYSVKTIEKNLSKREKYTINNMILNNLLKELFSEEVNFLNNQYIFKLTKEKSTILNNYLQENETAVIYFNILEQSIFKLEKNSQLIDTFSGQTNIITNYYQNVSRISQNITIESISGIFECYITYGVILLKNDNSN